MKEPQYNERINMWHCVGHSVDIKQSLQEGHWWQDWGGGCMTGGDWGMRWGEERGKLGVRSGE